MNGIASSSQVFGVGGMGHDNSFLPSTIFFIIYDIGYSLQPVV